MSYRRARLPAGLFGITLRRGAQSSLSAAGSGSRRQTPSHQGGNKSPSWERVKGAVHAARGQHLRRWCSEPLSSKVRRERQPRRPRDLWWDLHACCQELMGMHNNSRRLRVAGLYHVRERTARRLVTSSLCVRGLVGQRVQVGIVWRPAALRAGEVPHFSQCEKN